MTVLGDRFWFKIESFTWSSALNHQVVIIPGHYRTSYANVSFKSLVATRMPTIVIFLRHDPAFKAACYRLPLSGDPLGSQATMSRLENVVGPRDLYRMTRALVDLFLDSYDQAPKAILLDIDDTNDTTHGTQQLALFNAHYGDYGYQPLH